MTDYYIPPFEPFSLDISFCTNTDCPFKKCRRNLKNLENYGNDDIQITVSDLSGVCRTYIGFLVGEAANNHDT